MIEYFVKNASSYGGEIDWLFDLITYIVGFWFLLTFGATLGIVLGVSRVAATSSSLLGE